MIGVTLEPVSIYDVVPTVLRILDLPIAEDLPGRVLTEALDENWLARHPARHVSSYAGPPFEVSDPDPELSSPGDEALKQELRSLGYIE